MENHFKMVFLSYFRHENHQQHVLVDGFGSLAEYRCTFKLVRSYLIMSGLELDAEFICFRLEVLHECSHTARNCTEIVV